MVATAVATTTSSSSNSTAYYAHNTNQFLDNEYTLGLDYGTWLAYEYYFKSLRVFLLDTVTATTIFHDERLTMPQLFILVPTTQYLSTDIQDITHGNLEAVLPSNNSVTSSSYEPNLYALRVNGTVLHLAVGIVPELIYFFEIQQYVHNEGFRYRFYAKHLLNNFVKTLKYLIARDSKTRNCCELIRYTEYFDDEDVPKDMVANLLANRVRKYARAAIAAAAAAKA